MIVRRADALARGLSKYFTGKACKQGHIADRYINGHCVVCSALDAQRRNATDEERQRNKDRMRSRRSRSPTMRENERKKAAEYRAALGGRYRQYKNAYEKTARYKEWRRAYRQRDDVRERENEAARNYFRREYNAGPEMRRRIVARNRNRIKNDPLYRLATRLRQGLYKALRRNTKRGSAVQLLGCTIEELRRHIERQFLPGMKWENWSHSVWHIDHVRPFASFDLSDPNQLAQACHYTNLRPLWAFDNMSKGAKVS
jgi:hypothetical protein